jgi:hypothetical protein
MENMGNPALLDFQLSAKCPTEKLGNQAADSGSKLASPGPCLQSFLRSSSQHNSMSPFGLDARRSAAWSKGSFSALEVQCPGRGLYQ